MIGYAGDYKTALTARTTSIGAAETAYTSAISQAASARTSQDGSSISAAVASAQAADYQSLTGTQSAMSTFGTASSAAGTQYLANVKPKLVDFASDSTAAQWDYQEGHAAERLTKAQAAATANPTTETAITLAKAEGHQVYVDGLRGEAIGYAKSIIGDLLSYEQAQHGAVNQLGSSSEAHLNGYAQSLHSATSSHELAQLQAGSTYTSSKIASSGQLSIDRSAADATFGSQLATNYGDYLVDVYTALKTYGVNKHSELESVRNGANAAFDLQLLNLDKGQVTKAADADLAWSDTIAGNLATFNQSNVAAAASLMKANASAVYSYDTQSAAADKTLTTNTGSSFRLAQTAAHNASTALLIDEATSMGNWALAKSNQQLAGAEKLHLELDLPYSQFLVDRATANKDAASSARQSIINHALNINDAANFQLVADQMASSLNEQANAAAVQSHALTVAGSALNGGNVIAGSFASTADQLAQATKAYQQAEAQIRRDHRVAVQQAERQYEHDENVETRDTAIATANQARDSALQSLRQAYVTQEIQLNGAHQLKLAQETLTHTNNVGQSRISTTSSIVGNTRDYQHSLADSRESYLHTVTDSEVSLAELLAEDRLDAHDAVFAENSDPWSKRHLAEEVAAEIFVKTIWPSIGARNKDHATANAQRAKSISDSVHDVAIGAVTAEAQLELAWAAAEEQNAADTADNQLNNANVLAYAGRWAIAAPLGGGGGGAAPGNAPAAIEQKNEPAKVDKEDVKKQAPQAAPADSQDEGLPAIDAANVNVTEPVATVRSLENDKARVSVTFVGEF